MIIATVIVWASTLILFATGFSKVSVIYNLDFIRGLLIAIVPAILVGSYFIKRRFISALSLTLLLFYLFRFFSLLPFVRLTKHEISYHVFVTTITAWLLQLDIAFIVLLAVIVYYLLQKYLPRKKLITVALVVADIILVGIVTYNAILPLRAKSLTISGGLLHKVTLANIFEEAKLAGYLYDENRVNPILQVAEYKITNPSSSELYTVY